MEFQDLSGMVMSIITMKMMTMVLILATMMIMLNPEPLICVESSVIRGKGRSEKLVVLN